MNTACSPMYEWKDLPWKQYERQIFKLQKRIYQASCRGNVQAVHKLQRLLMKSWSARCLAVRRVTQDNRGKKTAGVDGIKSLTPKQRLKLAQALHLSQKAKPTRRVWIPKPGKTEKRPLGIPTIRDRAEQTLVKMALEPEWEAKFEPNSYGFRPGRSCHDAIEAVFRAIMQKPKYALDADIAKCFDRICHTALLKKLDTFPQLRRSVRAWLKAGVMDGKEMFPTTEGAPQGGPLSPLLANIALHGLEETVATKFPQAKVFRYADDFVAFHHDLATIEQIQTVVSEWLTGMGLELKPSKTRITHTLNAHQGEVGFDFLGFNIRQHSVGKTHSGKKYIPKQKYSRLLGFKTIIKPSREACHRHLQTLREIVQKQQAAPQGKLIDQLNPVIRGWTKYYSTVVSKAIFSKMDHLLHEKLYRWARHRHSQKSRKWVFCKYWHPQAERKWNFATRNGRRLFWHGETPIQRYIKVKGNRSPYDGDWVYWGSRQGRHPTLPNRIAYLMKKQRGKCTCCGLYFKMGDVLEVDHLIPLFRNGKDEMSNRQLLHGYCHDRKTAQDKLGTHNKSQAIEEPCEVESLTHGFEDESVGRLTGLV
jgi:RNA-directed DNA polymerase